MTFDELWRANLAQKRRRTDSVRPMKSPVDRTVELAEVKDPNELELTAEDRTFLLQIGIRP
jgi:hypothetical protein